MQENVRALIGWMDEDEAIRTLLGQRHPNPNEDISSQRSVWQAAHECVLARDAFNQATPVLGPIPTELKDLRVQFAARPELIAAFQQFDWSVGMAPLRTRTRQPKAV